MLSHRAAAGIALTVLIASVMAGLAPVGAAETAPQGQASRVAVITGAQSINATETRYQIKGTDLGIMWADDRGQILAAFGDTFGPRWGGPGTAFKDPAAVDWRSNTLARSSDRNPAGGMSFTDFITDRADHAKELLPSLKRDGTEMTKIPTGGINVGGRNYLAYMSVRHFGQPGRWTTNYSGIAYSDDGGQNWVAAPTTLRPNTAAGDDKFQMIAFARRDGFVYVFGTPNGRFGDAYVARVPERQLLNPLAYHYWTGSTWQLGTSALATPIVTGPVGELSVRYDEILRSWEMMYLDESRGEIVLRLASQPTGPWGTPIPVASFSQYPHLYGGFMNPDSRGTDIYFTMTQYDRYNVSLMHVRLPANVLSARPVPRS
jgi:hypothetical protein